MTYGEGRWFFPGAGVAALAAIALFAAACSTVEDVPMAEGRSGAPTDTGTFPNLNIPPQAATAQFTDEEKQAKLAQLRAVQQSQNRGRSRRVARSPPQAAQACGRRAGRDAEGHRERVTLDP